MKQYRQSEGFVYLWKDTKRNKYYLGSHLGSLDDGYTGSNNRFQCAYKSRPHTFKRKILEHYTNITSKQLLDREQLWLNLIHDEELHGIKYYNEKRVAAGGDIISTLPKEKKISHSIKSGIASKKYWDNISEEDYQRRRDTAFGGNIFDRSYMQTSEYRENMSVATMGEKNGFFGKTHTEENKQKFREWVVVNKPRQKKYKITFPDGSIDIVAGMDSIALKYCEVIKIKFSRFIDTNKPILSNRKQAKNSPLYGAIIEVVK